MLLQMRPVGIAFETSPFFHPCIAHHIYSSMYNIIHFDISFVHSGYIRGDVGEVPELIAFQPKFDHGAMLTIVSIYNYSTDLQQRYQTLSSLTHYPPGGLPPL